MDQSQQEAYYDILFDRILNQKNHPLPQDKDLTCPICFESYNTKDRDPIVLNCGHTYCRACIDTLIKQSKRLVFKCPFDKQVHWLDSFGAKNFALANIIEKNALTPANATFQLYCNEHNNENIKFYCSESKRLFCNQCFINQFQGDQKPNMVSISLVLMNEVQTKVIAHQKTKLEHKVQQLGETIEKVSPDYRDLKQMAYEQKEIMLSNIHEWKKREIQKIIEQFNSKVGKVETSFETEFETEYISLTSKQFKQVKSMNECLLKKRDFVVFKRLTGEIQDLKQGDADIKGYQTSINELELEIGILQNKQQFIENIVDGQRKRLRLD